MTTGTWAILATLVGSTALLALMVAGATLRVEALLHRLLAPPTTMPPPPVTREALEADRDTLRALTADVAELATWARTHTDPEPTPAPRRTPSTCLASTTEGDRCYLWPGHPGEHRVKEIGHGPRGDLEPQDTPGGAHGETLQHTWPLVHPMPATPPASTRYPHPLPLPDPGAGEYDEPHLDRG